MSDLGLYRGLGSQLLDKGKWFLKQATPFKETVFTASQMLTKLREITGLPVSKLYSADEKHYTTDIDTWKTIIENDWTEKMKYLSDRYDCDNYAGSFSAYCSEIYGINSVARVTVELRDTDGVKHIGYHRCCIIVDDKLDCYLLEAQSDKMVLLERGKKPIIDKWLYVPLYIDLN